jgi:hypothetical protein
LINNAYHGQQFNIINAVNVPSNQSPSHTVGTATDLLIAGAVFSENVATLTKTEQNDSLSSASSVLDQASFQKANASATLSSTAANKISASTSISNAVNTLVGSTTHDVHASSAFTEQSDTLLGFAKVNLVANLSVSNQLNALASTGTVALAGTLTKSEALDVVSSGDTVTISATSSIYEQNDGFSGTILSLVSATVNALDQNNTLTATGVFGNVVTADFTVTEQSMTLSASGSMTVQASLAKNEDSDSLSAISSATINIYCSQYSNMFELDDTLSSQVGIIYDISVNVIESLDSMTGLTKATILVRATPTEAVDHLGSFVAHDSNFLSLNKKEANDSLASTTKDLVHASLTATNSPNHLASTVINKIVANANIRERAGLLNSTVVSKLQVLFMTPPGTLYTNVQIPNSISGGVWPHLIDIYIPTTFNGIVSTVILHGGGGNKLQVSLSLGILVGAPAKPQNVNWSLLDTWKGMVVIPQGQWCTGVVNDWNPNGVNSVSPSHPYGIPTWSNHFMWSQADDLDFLSDLSDYIVNTYGTQRPTIAGHSSGGIMAHRMWYEKPTKYGRYIGSSAPAASYYDGLPAPTLARPFLTQFGRMDTTLDINGGPAGPGDHFFDPWWYQNPTHVTVEDVTFPSKWIGDFRQLPTRVNAYNSYNNLPSEVVNAADGAVTPIPIGTQTTWSYSKGYNMLQLYSDADHQVSSHQAVTKKHKYSVWMGWVYSGL